MTESGHILDRVDHKGRYLSRKERYERDERHKRYMANTKPRLTRKQRSEIIDRVLEENHKLYERLAKL